MQDTGIPVKFDIVWASGAGAGYIRVVPDAPQPGGAASFTTGFSQLNFIPEGSGGVPPFGQDFNGIMQAVTAWLQWYQAGAPVSYDATFSSEIGGYPKGAIVQSATSFGTFWISTADGNTSNPDSGGANWTGYSPATFYGVDTGSANTLAVAFTIAPPSQAFLIGKRIAVKKSASANTGGATLNVNALGAVAVVHGDGTALQANELPAGGVFSVVYDGTYYYLQSTANVPAAIPPNSITNTMLATMPTLTVKGNITGGTATPTDVPISSLGISSPAGWGWLWYTNAPPTGTVELNGATLSRTTYSTLNAIAAAFGYAAPWGPGNGTTTFTIPDMRGYFPRAWDDGAGVDPARTFGSVQADALASHNHPTGIGSIDSDSDVYGFTAGTTAGGCYQRQSTPGSHQTITGMTGGTETRPKNVAIMFVMKY